MKYSYTWLQSHIEESLPKPEVLKEKIIFHAFEVEDVEEKHGDTIFDIKVLPDRAGDCLSHYGMAREIAGLLNLTLKPHAAEALPEIPLLLPVEVKSDVCRRYIAVRIDGVQVGPSPLWLKHSLESIGQRSINNIVDATNYVLFGLGQPTHAFDSASIDGGIIVRAAHEGETIITLSDETKTLTPDMTVIADYIGALAIAGVKGGKNAEVSEETTSVVLEVANFDPVVTRRTARSLNLPTDAAKRFENNLSPVTARYAAQSLVALIKDVAGGEVTGVSDIYPKPAEPRTLTFAVTDIARLLGDWVTAHIIKDVFDRYHYAYTSDDMVFTLTVPYWRADITGAHDIAEEIGRVVGYESIAPAALPATCIIDHSPIYKAIRAAKAWLVHDGYREVMTYGFQKKGEVEIVRGPKGKSMLRTNLSDALKESFEMNRLNAALLGISKVKLFEIGTVFFADREEVHVATAEKGMIKETTLDAYIAEHSIVIDTATLETTPSTNRFTPWSPYPYITRDIAVWVTTDEDKDTLATSVKTFADKHCVRPAALFDQFTKDGKTSIAYRLVFQATDRTLTEAEVETWFRSLTQEIVAKGVFEIR